MISNEACESTCPEDNKYCCVCMRDQADISSCSSDHEVVSLDEIVARAWLSIPIRRSRPLKSLPRRIANRVQGSCFGIFADLTHATYLYIPHCTIMLFHEPRGLALFGFARELLDCHDWWCQCTIFLALLSQTSTADGISVRQF